MFSWFSSGKPAAHAAAAPTNPAAAAREATPTGPSAETQLERLRRQDELQKLQEEQQERRSPLSGRSLRQLGLFVAGAGFLLWTTAITRRAVARKQIAAQPKFYQPSTYSRPTGGGGSSKKGGGGGGGGKATTDPDADGGLIAVQALGLATLNVFSFAIMMTGGLSWAFDVSSVDDLRAMARRAIGPGGGKSDEESEREVEEWVARMISRGKENPGATAAAAATTADEATTAREGKQGR